MSWFRLGAFTLLIYSSLATANNNDSSVLRVVTEGAYPPFSEIDSQGNLIGFDVEIAQALCKQMKRECNLSAHSWDGIIPSLLSRKYDLIVASLARTEARAKRLAFSVAYYEASASLLTFKTNPATQMNWETFKTKKGALIGVQQATMQEKWLMEKANLNQIRGYADYNQALLDLIGGRLEVLLLEEFAADRMVELNDVLKYLGEPIQDESLNSLSSVAARKNDQTLIEEVNQALKEIYQNGTYQAISQAYFGKDIASDALKEMAGAKE